MRGRERDEVCPFHFAYSFPTQRADRLFAGSRLLS